MQRSCSRSNWRKKRSEAGGFSKVTLAAATTARGRSLRETFSITWGEGGTPRSHIRDVCCDGEPRIQASNFIWEEPKPCERVTQKVSSFGGPYCHFPGTLISYPVAVAMTSASSMRHLSTHLTDTDLQDLLCTGHGRKPKRHRMYIQNITDNYTITANYCFLQFTDYDHVSYCQLCWTDEEIEAEQVKLCAHRHTNKHKHKHKWTLTLCQNRRQATWLGKMDPARKIPE